MIDMEEALRRYRKANDSGEGYAPYTDVPGDDTVSVAIQAALTGGWEVVLYRESSSDVVVLRNGDGDLIAIGGDAQGRSAWAVIL